MANTSITAEETAPDNDPAKVSATVAGNKRGLDVSLISGGLLAGVAYDSIVVSAASTTDVFTYKSGGVSGTTVATVTLNYTNSSKATLSSIVRT